MKSADGISKLISSNQKLSSAIGVRSRMGRILPRKLMIMIYNAWYHLCCSTAAYCGVLVEGQICVSRIRGRNTSVSEVQSASTVFFVQ